MKAKIKIMNKKQVQIWIEINNLYAKSMCDQKEILSQFNSLKPNDKINIKKLFKECDDVRKIKLADNSQDEWIIGSMVDAHIIAYEYNVDPLTVILCANPICKPNEIIIVK